MAASMPSRQLSGIFSAISLHILKLSMNDMIGIYLGPDYEPTKRTIEAQEQALPEAPYLRLIINGSGGCKATGVATDAHGHVREQASSS